MKRFIVILSICFVSLMAQSNRTFYLKSGEKISGIVLSFVDSLECYIIETEYGILEIYQKDIMPSQAIVWLNSGDKIAGELIEDTDLTFKIKTAYGLVEIKKNKINKIDISSSAADSVEYSLGEEDPAPWYFSEQRLINILDDPTGFVLEANTLYFSITEWGYGASERFQFTSNWNAYFWGDLNIRPKVMLFKIGDIQSEQAMSAGLHLHMKGPCNKYEMHDYDSDWDYDNYWQKIGKDDDENIWGEAFTSYTLSQLRESGRGRADLTFGASATFYPGRHAMPRAFIGLSTDVRRNLKLFAKVLVDEYSPSWYYYINDKKEKYPVKIDFGFLLLDKQGMQIGIHFQKPWVMVFYTF